MALQLRMVEGDGGGGFDLLLHDRVVIAHRADAPALRLGHANPRVTMVRGNFRLDDEPVRQAVPVHAMMDGDGRVALSETAGGAVLARLAIDGGQVTVDGADWVNRLTIDGQLSPGECVWGGGEQMSHLALGGRRFPLWTSEPGVGREPGTPLTDLMSADGSFAGGDYWTTNYPQPTVLTSRGLSWHLEGTSYSEIDLTAPDRLRWHIWDGKARFRIHADTTPAAAVSRLAAGFGVPPELPAWASEGAIVGLKDGARSFDRLEAILDAGAAVSGLWCEDWVGIRQTSFGRRLFWDWQWNPARYPDLPDRIAALKSRGIRFLGYVNPYLAADGPLFAEAAERGFLARERDSDRPYLVDFGEFDAGVVDFTAPDASDWFAEELIGKRMIDFGLDGWMADFGEYLPVDLRLARGDPMEAHNQWPVLWAEVNNRAFASRGKAGEIVWFMRAGYTGVQGLCPLLWAGDQSVDFSRHDGIGTVITAALSSGLVGNRVSHSDVGGYTSLHGNVRTEELMRRWFELGAFTPVMRTHEGNRPDDNLQIDTTPALLSDFARWSRVHAALAPLVADLLGEAQASGLPCQRALFLHYPQDRETFAIQDQYLYGADLMVAPVIEEGAHARRVYLPGGGDAVWRHMWSGADHRGGWHTIDAPLGSPPVFYRPEAPRAALFAALAAVRGAA